MAEAHSLFSASGAAGWSTCHGKVAMERGHRTSSEYADEGTAAHQLASWVLENVLGRGTTANRSTLAAGFIGEVIKVKGSENSPERSFTVDEEMAENVQDYVDFCISETEGPQTLRFVEQRVHYHEALGTLKGEAFGTSDFNAIYLSRDPEHLGWTLCVADLKYGVGVRVDAEGNPQPRLYGTGALAEFLLLADIVWVRMIIHQPRLNHVSEEWLSVEELAASMLPLAQAVPKVKEAMATAGKVKPADAPKALHAAGFLAPSEKACKFCDGKPFCPALAAEVRSAVSGGTSTAADFEDLTVDTPADVHAYGDNFIHVSAQALALIDIWQKSVRQEIDRRVLLEGKTVEGFKVVAGKRGDRKFSDEAAASRFITMAGLPIDKTHNPAKLKTPAQLEKSIKAQPVWLQLQPLIVQSEGKPAVVTLDDPRPAISHVAVRDDFEDMDAAEGATAQPSNAHPFRK